MTHEIYTQILGLCSFIIAVWAVVEIIMKIVEIRKRPDKVQNKTLKEHTEWLKRHDKKFDDIESLLKKDKSRLDDIDQSNHVTQRALLALLEHALNGNDIDKLKKAKDSLEEYLTNK